jgi:hypothetical protein
MTMSDGTLVEALWALANGITAFAVLQALACLYALGQRDFVNALSNRTASLLVVAGTTIFTIAYCLAVWKCAALASVLIVDKNHQRIWSMVTAGRIACIVMFNLMVLGIGLTTLLAPRMPPSNEL